MNICHNKKYEREFVNMMNQRGHLCLRIAGSGAGKEAVCDTILFCNGKTYLVEVKATREQVFYVRSHIKEQLNKLYDAAIKNSLISLLAIKFKYKGWSLIPVTKDMHNKIKYEDKNESSNICSCFN